MYYAKLLKFSILFGLIGFIPVDQHLMAQSTEINGIVVEESSGKPIEGANVYITGTAIGSSTDQNGTFSFSATLNSDKELTVSFVGYHTQKIPVEPGQDASDLNFHIELKADEYEMDDIIISADNTQWIENFRYFQNEFIGTNRFAEQTRILNRWVIDFTRESDGELYAMASEPIMIENRALGYRLHIDMEDFKWQLNRGTGHFFFDIDFQELQPASEAEYENWQRNRRDVYRGSIQHFFRSLFKNELSRNQFEIVEQGGTQNARIYPQQRNANVIRALLRHQIPHSQFGEEVKAFYMRGPVDILYGQKAFRIDDRRRAGLRPQISNLLFLVRKNGTLIEPQNISVEGYWGNERIANMLPSNYQP